MAQAPGNAQTANAPAQPPPATQPAPVPSGGPNANPLDLFPQVAFALLLSKKKWWQIFLLVH